MWINKKNTSGGSHWSMWVLHTLYFNSCKIIVITILYWLKQMAHSNYPCFIYKFVKPMRTVWPCNVGRIKSYYLWTKYLHSLPRAHSNYILHHPEHTQGFAVLFIIRRDEIDTSYTPSHDAITTPLIKTSYYYTNLRSAMPSSLLHLSRVTLI